MPFAELNEEPNLTVNWNGQQFGARRFKVWGGPTRTQICYSPETISDGSGGTLDPRGSIWNGMYLDSYSAVGVGSGVYDVTALYSTEQRRLKFSTSFQTESVPIPYSIRKTNNVPAYSAVTAEGIISQYGWGLAEQLFQMSVGRMFVTVNFAVFGGGGGESSQWQDIIKGKLNRLHKPFGSKDWHRFESADVVFLGGFNIGGSPASELYYQASYAWVFESGLPYRQGYGDTPITSQSLVRYSDPVQSKLTGGNIDGGWLLPPFHKLIPYRNVGASGDVNIPYSFEAQLPYVEDEFGWSDLPGIN